MCACMQHPRNIYAYQKTHTSDPDPSQSQSQSQLQNSLQISERRGPLSSIHTYSTQYTVQVKSGTQTRLRPDSSVLSSFLFPLSLNLTQPKPSPIPSPSTFERGLRAEGERENILQFDSELSTKRQVLGATAMPVVGWFLAYFFFLWFNLARSRPLESINSRFCVCTREVHVVCSLCCIGSISRLLALLTSSTY